LTSKIKNNERPAETSEKILNLIKNQRRKQSVVLPRNSITGLFANHSARHLPDPDSDSFIKENLKPGKEGKNSIHNHSDAEDSKKQPTTPHTPHTIRSLSKFWSLLFNIFANK
jgi:hypothetical protein